MPDESTIETKPDPPTKPRIDHGIPHPEADALVVNLWRQIDGNPASPQVVLSWLATVNIETVRIAIMRSQNAPWSIAAQPLVDSLTDDQARAVLAAVVVGFYQGRKSVSK